MSASHIATRLVETLRKELELLEEYNQGCESLHKHVIAKNWTTLESILNNLKRKALHLDTLDQKRESIVQQLKKELSLQEEVSFGLVLVCLDEDTQRDIKVLKQKIRHAVSILQTRINGIGRYTESQTNILRDVLDELIPEQRGRIYNNRGTASSKDSKPLLFNHQF